MLLPGITKAAAVRSEFVKKAIELVEDPTKYDRATSYGAAKYVKDIRFDKETGEIVVSRKPSFDFEKLTEDEKHDGYYCFMRQALMLMQKVLNRSSDTMYCPY